MMEEVLGEPLAAGGREPPERANGDDGAQPYYGALPDGAPMARRPSRTDGPRAAELLHELFGRADSPT
jgi:hypothetical protein